MTSQQGELYNVPLSSDSEAGELSLRGNVFTNPADTQNTIVGSSSVESDLNGDEEEEKQRLITQVLELQNTLDVTNRSLPVLIQASSLPGKRDRELLTVLDGKVSNPE
ncbi:hypothetical protein MAR_022515, partial [Mya arenaria]